MSVFFTRKQPIELKILLLKYFFNSHVKDINYHKKTASTIVNKSNIFSSDI